MLQLTGMSVLCGFCLVATGFEFELFDDLSTYCPYMSLCNYTEGKPLNTSLDEESMLCCSACNCDDDCGLTGTCCFQSLDKYNPPDQVSCIPSGKGLDSVQAYYMVDSCTQNNNLTKEVNDILAPVDNIAHQTIFKNAYFAECNGVYDYRKWKVNVLLTDLPTTPLETRTITVSKAKRLTLPHYYYPQNANEWTKKQCLYHYADECLDPTLKRKCKSLDAPFMSQSRRRHKNVYCLMCFWHESHDNAICERDVQLPGKGFEKLDVYSLINYDALDTVDKNIHIRTENKRECPKGYIPSPLLGTCHLILCPEGMMMLGKGTCVYYIEWWYYDFYQISLTLTPTTGKVPISDITVIQNMNTKQALRYLHCPCMDVDWSLYWSVYCWNDTFGDVTALLITLHVEERGNGREPKPLINRLRSCFERRWALTDWGLQQEFTAQLSPYHVAPYYFIEDAFLLLNTIRYRRIKSITKLFFCEQVFLSKDDVVRENVFKITLNETGRVLYRNEFSEAGEDVEMSPTGYTVCLEDFNRDWWLKHHALNTACTPSVRDLRSVYMIVCIVVWQATCLYVD